MRRPQVDPPGDCGSPNADDVDKNLHHDVHDGMTRVPGQQEALTNKLHAVREARPEKLLSRAPPNTAFNTDDALSIATPVRKNTRASTKVATGQDNDEEITPDHSHEGVRHQKKVGSRFSQKWTSAIDRLTFPVKYVLLAMTHWAATHPYLCVYGTIFFSIGIALIGWQTNFVLESRENELWKPFGSMSAADGQWLDSGGFSGNEWTYDDLEDVRRLSSEYHFARNMQLPTRTGGQANQGQRRLVGEGGGIGYITVLIHKDGDNVVTLEGGDRLFEVHDAAISTPGYVDFCAAYGAFRQCPEGLDFVCETYNIPVGENAPDTCQRIGPTAFFLNNSKNYKSRAQTDRDVQDAMSFTVFPGEVDEFSLKHIIGYPVFDEDGVLASGVSYTTVFIIPDLDDGPTVNQNVLHRLLDLRERWLADSENAYRLEIFSSMSFSEEFQRGLVKDIPLAFLAFVLMAVFTMFAFSRFDGGCFNWVDSRTAVGFGAVFCVVLSTMTGYGFLFCIGVPFTSLTQLLVFTMFGIGLDDSFVIMTAYERTNPQKNAVERVHDAISEICLSIFMTTATSVLAFALGSLSATPAIRWLCVYALTTISIDFVYQVTFFIALLVIDETRVKARRRDWFCCCVVPAESLPGNAEITAQANTHSKHFAERIMIWYAKMLLKPFVKVIVLVSFSALFAACLKSARLMTVAFDFTNVLPSDSYIIDFNDAFNALAQTPSISPIVYFRFVDQSDPSIQAQMTQYVHDLVNQVDGITELPLQFWLFHFQSYLEENRNETLGLSFNETLLMFLDVKGNEQYRADLILDAQGNIIVSRTQMNLDNIDLSNVDEYLGSFRAIRKVGMQQPANQHGDWAFFAFDYVFYLWEFLNNTEGDLRISTICSVAAVSVMALLLMPHWSAVLFVFPMVTILFIDLMGFLRFFGITINGISYIALVMSVGLMVDYLMHVALRYYESTKEGRVEKTKDVLHSMGAAVLLGGCSTFLGTLALAFASTAIFHTVFITFCGIVILGVSHGLILLPVILSYIGPQ